MKKSMKSAAMLLISVLAASTLVTACSSGSSNQPNTSGAPGLSDSAKPDLEPVELTMVFPVNTEQKDLKAVEEEINKITQKKINATVKLVQITKGAWAQQTTLMLSGNEKMDLIVSGRGTYEQQVAKGNYLALDDYIAKYGQGAQKALDDLDPAYLKASRIDGKTYGITSIRDLASDFGISMRKDLVDKYKIDTNAIRSVDDLDTVFKVIKENEPDVTPVIKFSNSILGSPFSAGMMDPLGDGFGVLQAHNDGMKVVNWIETPEYAKLLDTTRRWYLAGYVAKDAATSTEIWQNLMKAGKAFSTFHHMSPFSEAANSLTVGQDLIEVRLLPAASGTTSVITYMWSIPRNAQNPERSMMLLDLMYTDKDFINLLDWGIEGQHYVKKSDNVIDFPEGVNASNSGYYPYENWLFGNMFLSYVFNGEDPDRNQKLEEFIKNSKKSKAMGFIYNPESVKTEIAALTNVVNQYALALETGTVDPAKVLPEYIKQMKAAGIDKVIAEKQKQLDAWAAANK
ncbi:ABC transporter substrate-binding protein [Paenibacillus selenitireducens]|uniref:ABC transporter substrate-binding protein n=1 Tax=Paenibacillus selenitireducens TaxID=1324314 RepID=A0A1T2XFQ0_9BACL|nr:ABC transporter substrate-binding protein [Paenibacillus selenitireducens]OPA78658.1 ABC transporter substrate-binding protein [Paenibacillus selenitireducens]